MLPGVEDLLPRLVDQGYLVGLITGNLEAAAHIKLGPVVPPAESGQWPSPFLDAKVVSCDFLSRVRVGLYRGLRHPTT